MAASTITLNVPLDDTTVQAIEDVRSWDPETPNRDEFATDAIMDVALDLATRLAAQA